VSQEDYDEYKEGFEADKEAAERIAESGWTDLAEEQLRGLFFDRYGKQSDMWWRGFHDGKDEHWDPPEVEDEAESD